MWGSTILELDAMPEVELEFTGSEATDFEASEHLSVAYTDLPDYEGPYEVTPGPRAQVLPTSARALWGDLTVAPIPSNYGLITYRGSILTVS